MEQSRAHGYGTARNHGKGITDMSFTVTVNTTITWTSDISGETKQLNSSFSLSSVVYDLDLTDSSDNTGWDELYDASDTTLPHGDSDAGDAPFLFAIKLTSASGAILRFTDNSANTWQEKIPAGETRFLGNLTGADASTNVLEMIEIQSASATACKYVYAIFKD